MNISNGLKSVLFFVFLVSFVAIVWAVVPTQNEPVFNSSLGTNLSSEVLRCYTVNVSDADDDTTKALFEFNKNGVWINIVHAPFDGNFTYLTDYSASGVEITVPDTLADPWVYNDSVWFDGMDFRGKFVVNGSRLQFSGLDYGGVVWNETTNQTFTYAFYINYTRANETACQSNVSTCTGLSYEQCVGSFENASGAICEWDSECVVSSGEYGRECLDGVESRENEVVWERGQGDYYIYLDAHNNTLKFVNGYSDYELAMPNDSLTAGTFYHVTLSRNGLNTTWYVRNLSVASGLDTDNITIMDVSGNGSMGDSVIGVSGSDDLYAEIDEFRILGVDATQDSVCYTYNLGVAGFSVIHSDLTTLGDVWYCNATILDDGAEDVYDNEDTSNSLTIIEEEADEVVGGGGGTPAVEEDDETEETTITEPEVNEKNDILLVVAFVALLVIMFRKTPKTRRKSRRKR